MKIIDNYDDDVDNDDSPCPPFYFYFLLPLRPLAPLSSAADVFVSFQCAQAVECTYPLGALAQGEHPALHDGRMQG